MHYGYVLDRLAFALGVAAAVFLTPAVASASPSTTGSGPDDAGPVLPLNGQYMLNTALDRQTFNGAPDPAIPFASEVSFSTTCDRVGCVAHSSLSVRDKPFDFRWTGTQWQAAQRIQWTCEGRTAPATVTFTLTPKPNGTLSGERATIVDAPGCGNPRVPGTVSSPLTAVPA